MGPPQPRLGPQPEDQGSDDPRRWRTAIRGCSLRLRCGRCSPPTGQRASPKASARPPLQPRRPPMTGASWSPEELALAVAGVLASAAAERPGGRVHVQPALEARGILAGSVDVHRGREAATGTRIREAPPHAAGDRKLARVVWRATSGDRRRPLPPAARRTETRPARARLQTHYANRQALGCFRRRRPYGRARRA